MQEKLMRYTAVFTTLIAFCAMFVMLRFAATKTIVVAEEVTAGSGAEQEYVAKKQESIPLKLSEDASIAPAILIPLPDNVRPNDIIIENHYVEHRINVIVAGAEMNYYQDTPISGSTGKVQAAACYEQGDGIVLAFRMDALYEHRYLLEEHALLLDFVTPHQMYDKIVVLDAGHGGGDRGITGHGMAEKDVTLAIVERVREELSGSDIRVYYTRQQDINLSTGERLDFINELRPDMVISVHLNDSDDADEYGTAVYYNEDYVIPILGNVELADLVERNVVLATDGRALGIFPCADEKDTVEAGFVGRDGLDNFDVLRSLPVPAAVLKVGYLSNAQEGDLLAQEFYLDRIADGICDAVYEAYQQLERVGY